MNGGKVEEYFIKMIKQKVVCDSVSYSEFNILVLSCLY